MDKACEPRAKRGRKRSKAADEAILAAARATLLELGYHGFTISEVVQRSGVSPATLYRRWESSQALVYEALMSLVPEVTAIDTGTFATDISAFIDEFADALESLGAFVLADRNDSRMEPEFRRHISRSFTEPRKDQLRAIFSRYEQRGELGPLPGFEDVWNFIAGPLHHRINLQKKPYTRLFAKQTKMFVMGGLRALTHQ